MSGLSDEDLRQLYRYGMALARDRDRACDLVHTAVVRWLAGGRAGVDNPRRYVMVILRNAHFDEGRRRARHNPEPLDDGDDSVFHLDAAVLEDVLVREDQLAQIWRRLSDSEREVLYLWAVEGYTMAEVSALTGIPKGTLLARVHRIRQKFKPLDDPGQVRDAP